MANLRVVKDWISLANTDIIGAKALFEMGENFFGLAVFHAQQSAEKSIKAYLVFQSVRVPKTHDLGDLLALVELKDKDLFRLLQPCVVLTDYAVAYRYPDSQKKPLEKNEVAIAIQQAEFTQTEVLKQIKV